MPADFADPKRSCCAFWNYSDEHIEALATLVADKVMHRRAREMTRWEWRIGSESIKFIKCLLLKPYFHLLKSCKGPVSEL